MTTSKFEELRPYMDMEIPDAMARIADSDLFPILSSYVFPTHKVEDRREFIRNISNIRQFQSEVMIVAAEQIIKRSVSTLTYNGIEYLNPNTKYLYVSNHRDIMLDSALLQYVLFNHGHETSEITFGANLMNPQLVVDIGKANKMFKVVRGGNIREFYKSSLLLSEYIRHTIKDKNQSVWIAQRNGRTKDGIDRTEPGLISMFSSSMPNDKVKALAELNIVPISISYEWETCDTLKSVELYKSQYQKYIKQPGEDLNSILSGILAHKGQVHIEICEPISLRDLMVLAESNKQTFVKEVAQLIDQRINGAYYLHVNNYIAFDIRYGVNKYADKYTTEEKQIFQNRLDTLSSYEECDQNILRDIFLGIYANPVISRSDALINL